MTTAAARLHISSVFITGVADFPAGIKHRQQMEPMNVKERLL